MQRDGVGLALTADVGAPPGALVLNLPEPGSAVNIARQYPTTPDDGFEGIQFIEVAMYRAQHTFTRDPDQPIRAAALAAIERLSRQHGGRVQWSDIQRGFYAEGEQVHFATRAKGIFKPRQMSAALSIKTVIPRSGREVWYRDQALAARTDQATGLLRYDLARGGPDEPSNRSLRKAKERGAPLIYFAGRSPSEYHAPTHLRPPDRGTIRHGSAPAPRPHTGTSAPSVAFRCVNCWSVPTLFPMPMEGFPP